MDSLEQLIEELVNRTSGSTPARIDEVQRSIQKHQRGPFGWELGLELLTKDGSHFRFYGALTLMVKIRTDWASVEQNPEIRATVLHDLISAYVKYTNGAEQRYVIQKMSSTLSAFFVRSHGSWQFPVRHIVSSLFANQIVLDGDLVDTKGALESQDQIHVRHLQSALWLSSSLVEETTRSDLLAAETVAAAGATSRSVLDVWYLIVFTLRCVHAFYEDGDVQQSHLPSNLVPCSEDELQELSKEALETASAWLIFQNSSDSSGDTELGVVSIVLKQIFQCFHISSTTDSTVTCLTSLLQQAPSHISKSEPTLLSSLLTSKQAGLYVSQLLDGDFEPEAIRYVIFVTGLLDLYDLSSPDVFQDSTLVTILDTLQRLLYTPGTAILVDETCQTVLDAFNQIADRWGDWVGTDQVDHNMKPLIQGACVQYVIKTQYPPNESESSIGQWEPDDRARFQDFRQDVQDLLLASYVCIGVETIDSIISSMDPSSSFLSWEDFESRLYCLGAFSDTIQSKREELGRYILGVFSLNQWQTILQNANLVPERARRGAISFISRNNFMLEDDQRHLIACINFLFASLRLPGSHTSASRGISALCHSQRKLLVGALSNFIESLSLLGDIASEERQRISNGIGAIIQALPSESLKVEPLSRLLTVIQSFGASGQQPDDTGLSAAIDLLQTFAAVGKGLRAPSDVPIDVDAQYNTTECRFWTDGGGSTLQNNLQQGMDHILAKFPNEPSIVDAACDILRSGYTETHPSAFKFNPSYTATFFTQNISLVSPRVGSLIDTAAALLAASELDNGQMREQCFLISSTIIRMQRVVLDTLAATHVYNDHEFTHSSLQYFARLLPRHGYYFEDNKISADWQILFEFALTSLTNADTLPRRASAQFWASVFDFSSSDSDAASENVIQCIEFYGPRFTSILLSLIGGGAARSELDTLCEPLKKLVAKQGVLAARILRKEALNTNSQALQPKRFVEQVLALRGARKTIGLVKEFWLESRGADFAYT